MSSMAQELSSQAEQLESSISFFHTNGHGRRAIEHKREGTERAAAETGSGGGPSETGATGITLPTGHTAGGNENRNGGAGASTKTSTSQQEEQDEDFEEF
jgi:hypothetical protein